MSYENIPKNIDETAVLVEPSPANPPFNINPVSDHRQNVAQGLVPGQTIKVVQGENLDVDTIIPENLWCAGGVLEYPTSGEQLEILSSSNNDEITGIGAQSVLLTYLDTSYITQTEVIGLDGTTPVLTVATDIFRVQDLDVIAVGANGFNLGSLELRVAGGGLPRACAAPNENTALHGFYTVPAGKTAYIVWGNATCKKSDEAHVDIYVTNGIDGVLRRFRFADLFSGASYLTPSYPIGPIEEFSDLQFRATSFDVNNEVSAFLQILVVDNT